LTPVADGIGDAAENAGRAVGEMAAGGFMAGVGSEQFCSFFGANLNGL